MSDNQVIPDTAVEAALMKLPLQSAPFVGRVEMRAALEAAAPIMLSHEREQTRLAHVDAVVNARTVDKLNTAIERVEALCRDEEARQTSKAYAAVDDIRAAILKALL